MVANLCLDYFSLYNRMNGHGSGPLGRGQGTGIPTQNCNLGRPRGHQLTRSLSASSALHLPRRWRNACLIQQELQPLPSTAIVPAHLTNQQEEHSVFTDTQQRIPSHLSQSYTRLRPQMTVGNLQARTRPLQPQRSMDSYFIDDIFSDHSLPASEVGSLDTSIYASSPNSLYMYDQEKADMQSSYNNPSNVPGLFFNEEFDLKAQYEASHDICPQVSSPASSGSHSTTTVAETVSWDNDTDSKVGSDLEKPIDIFAMDTSSVSGPTLAELNSSLTSLNSELLEMEDIESIVKNPLHRHIIDDKTAVANFKTTVRSGVTPVTTSRALGYPSSKGSNIKTSTSNSGSDLINWSALTKTVLSPDHFISQGPQMTRMKTFPPSVSNVVPQTDVKSAPSLQRLLQQNVKPATSVSPQLSSQSMKISTSPIKRRSPPTAVGIDVRALDQKWEEIKLLIDDQKESSEAFSPPQPKIKRDSRTSVSSTISNTSIDDDEDDGDSDIDSDIDGDITGHHWMSDSDMESEESQESWRTGHTKDAKSKKERQYFWQYNIQSKGPKGTRVDFGMDTSDPHVLHDFEDPVFDPHTSMIVGMGTAIRHGGKARKGDGNDVAPNPKKLCQIGQQLKRLNKQINGFAPLNELPVPSRNKSKKEKNKLASRACRLKKKAQHEANKLKLFGLELEHKQLMKVLQRIREELKIQINKNCESDDKPSMVRMLEDLIKENLSQQVAGNTTEYVNKITKCVDEGDPTGGLKLDQT